MKNNESCIQTFDYFLFYLNLLPNSRHEQRCQMEAPETKQEDFKALVSDAARPFLMARTDRFVNEMQLFLASGLNIEAYDAVYMQRLGWNTPRVTMESGEGETSGQTLVIPYLHIFDEDSDGTG